ncbi:MAG: hypothetical protein FWF28_01050 [Micrococcales bacterium]|nr:hypothetical protein [Micrococcales bacterium]
MAVAPYIGGTELGQPSSERDQGAGALFAKLIMCCAWKGRAAVWLLLYALSGALPTTDEVQTAHRILDLERGVHAEIDLLEIARDMLRRGDLAADLQVIANTVLVSLDAVDRPVAWHELGKVLPHWIQGRVATPLTWTTDTAALRVATSTGASSAHDSVRRTRSSAPTRPETVILVAPWNSTLVMPDSPPDGSVAPLVALTRYSGNRLVIVGHDTAPVFDTHRQAPADVAAFARYLEVVKYASTVATVDASAHVAYSGFAAALTSQGLSGPAVVDVPAPSNENASTHAWNRYADDLWEVVMRGAAS